MTRKKKIPEDYIERIENYIKRWENVSNEERKLNSYAFKQVQKLSSYLSVYKHGSPQAREMADRALKAIF